MLTLEQARVYLKILDGAAGGSAAAAASDAAQTRFGSTDVTRRGDRLLYALGVPKPSTRSALAAVIDHEPAGSGAV